MRSFDIDLKTGIVQVEAESDDPGQQSGGLLHKRIDDKLREGWGAQVVSLDFSMDAQCGLEFELVLEGPAVGERRTLRGGFRNGATDAAVEDLIAACASVVDVTCTDYASGLEIHDTAIEHKLVGMLSRGIGKMFSRERVLGSKDNS